MKRILPLLLLLIYSISISGATFHLHYCASYLESVSIIDNDHKGCCCENGATEMRRTDNCCQDVTVVIKADTVHQLSGIATSVRATTSGSPVIIAPVLMLAGNLRSIHSDALYASFAWRTEPEELLQLHCIYRI